MKRSGLLLLVGLFAAWPSVASAQDGWFGWLEELSGPGPFYSYDVSVRLFCALDGGRAPASACFADRSADPKNPIRGVFELRASWLTSGNNPRFKDAPADTRPVHGFRLDPIYLLRVDRALDIGAGAGFIRFSGEGFDPLYRFTFTPLSVSFVPLAVARDSAWTRVLRVRFEETYLTKGFVGADFGNRDTKFSTGGEFKTTAGIVVNFVALMEALR